MIGRYREGVLPEPGELADVDREVVDRTNAITDQLHSAYEKLELQQCALLPIELARVTNGYIDSTEPFKLAKDPAKSARLDTVLNLSAQAVYRALVSLLPILPEKAKAGLQQLGVDPGGKTLQELLAKPLAAGQKFGEGVPLFPRLEPVVKASS
jgi:methionyl-tRNA synthetase